MFYLGGRPFKAIWPQMKLENLIPSTLLRKAREYSRKLWVRVVIMGLLAPLTLGFTQIVELFVPDDLAQTVAGDSADRLLDIITNALLAVTTFSITAMVTVHRSASSQFTPRIHQLILQDRTTQNTMAVFIGAFVYALLGVILRELKLFVDERAFVLFFVTMLVLAVIVVYLVRWVLHLQTFGSLLDTTRQIERTIREQLKERGSTPCLGGNAYDGDPPSAGETVYSDRSGYLQYIFPEALDQAGKDCGLDIYILRQVGDFVFVDTPLYKVVARGTGTAKPLDAQTRQNLCDKVEIGDLRTFDQDPVHGFRALGEVASKALSPGINDPGTAMDVITRAGRLIMNYKSRGKIDDPPALEHIHMRPLQGEEVINAAFAALARDGAGMFEVQQTLQMVLANVITHPDTALSDAARTAAEHHLRRALEQITFGPERDQLLVAAHSEVRAKVEREDRANA